MLLLRESNSGERRPLNGDRHGVAFLRITLHQQAVTTPHTSLCVIIADGCPRTRFAQAARLAAWQHEATSASPGVEDGDTGDTGDSDRLVPASQTVASRLVSLIVRASSQGAHALLLSLPLFGG